MVMRRRRAWSDTIVLSSLAGGGSVTFDLLEFLTPTETKTVSRILVDLTAILATATDETEFSANIFVGIGVVSLEAFTAGVLPDAIFPTDYPTQGWVYVNNKPMVQSLHPTGVFMLPAHFEADLRGQRKVDRGVLFLTVNNILLTSSATVRIVGRVRALCLT